MHKSHTEMVRMKSSEDNDYQIIAMQTQLMCEEAPKKIGARWNAYDGLHSQFMPLHFSAHRSVNSLGGDVNFDTARP